MHVLRPSLYIRIRIGRRCWPRRGAEALWDDDVARLDQRAGRQHEAGLRHDLELGVSARTVCEPTHCREELAEQLDDVDLVRLELVALLADRIGRIERRHAAVEPAGHAELAEAGLEAVRRPIAGVQHDWPRRHDDRLGRDVACPKEVVALEVGEPVDDHVRRVAGEEQPDVAL